MRIDNHPQTGYYYVYRKKHRERGKYFYESSSDSR